MLRPILRQSSATWQRLSSPASQRGQALTEFCVASAFVLVPLFLMIPLLGKYMDMKASTIQAARYAAWERTVWYDSAGWDSVSKSDTEIALEIKNRFFSDSASDPGFKNTDRTANNNTAGKALWRDQAGVSMLKSYSASDAKYQTPGTVNNYLEKITSAVNTVVGFLGANFKLDMDSLYKSTVTLDTKNTNAVQLATGATASGFEAPKFSMHQVLVANGWSAKGPEFVDKQIRALAPFTALSNTDAPTWMRKAKKGMDTVQGIAGNVFEELGTDSLVLGGRVQPDAVPPDRLVRSASTPAATTTPKPKPTLAERQKEADEKSDSYKNQETNLREKIKKFNDDATTVSNKLNSCKVDESNEYNRNHVKDTHYDNGCIAKYQTFNQCNGQDGANNPKEILRQPPNGPSTSYTPNADADVNCHSGLDLKIASLQTLLNDPVFQKPLTDSNEELAKDQTRINNPAFAERRADTLSSLSLLQARIDILKLQKDINDLADPLADNLGWNDLKALNARRAKRIAKEAELSKLKDLVEKLEKLEKEIGDLKTTYANKIKAIRESHTKNGVVNDEGVRLMAEEVDGSLNKIPARKTAREALATNLAGLSVRAN